MKKIKLIILDLAGTSVDYGSQAPIEAFTSIFNRFGINVPEDYIRAFMGLNKRDHIANIMQISDIQKEWQKRYKKEFSCSDLDVLYKTLLYVMPKAVTRHTDLILNTAKITKHWQETGIKVGVDTGYSRKLVKIILKAVKPQGFNPDISVATDEIKSGRPAPWSIFKIMENLDIYPPNLVVKIGDTKADVQAGKNAGVWTIGLIATGNLITLPPNKAKQILLSAGADYVAKSINECPKIIEHINNKLNNQIHTL